MVTHALPIKMNMSRTIGYAAAFSLLVVVILISLAIPQYKISLIDRPLSLLSFAIIGIITFVSLFFAAAKRPFTLNSIHWTFMLYFMFYAPFLQFVLNREPTNAPLGKIRALHMEINGILLLWCVCYFVAYHFVEKKMRKRNLIQQSKQEQNVSRQVTEYRVNMALLCGMCLLSLLLTYAVMGSAGFGSRADASNSGADNMSSLIVNSFLRYIPVAATAILLLSQKRKNFGYIMALFITGGCAFIMNNPIAVPRFQFSTIAIGFIAILLRNKKITGLWLPVSIFVGLAFIMPVLNVGRHSSLGDISVDTVRSMGQVNRRRNDTDTNIYGYVMTFTAGDFDAYQMLANTVSYVDNRNGLSCGRQLMGTLLFFVPRQGWKDKPITSGEQVATGYKLWFKNLSTPSMSEGYINFGIIGVILFAVVFASLLAWMDSVYWASINRSFYIQVIYPFLCGLVFFNMRGALMTTFAYTVGFLLAALIMKAMAVKRLTQYVRLSAPPKRKLLRPLPENSSDYAAYPKGNST